jgi:UDP-N-acetylglucosamine acyltransferase
MGGLSAVHQFGRVGSQVMVSALTAVRGDVIPYGLANGQFAHLSGLNIVGMKRRKFTRERLARVRSFYQKLFHGPGVFAERLNEARHQAGADPAIAEILDFIDAGKHRELCQPLKAGRTP